MSDFCGPNVPLDPWFLWSSKEGSPTLTAIELRERERAHGLTSKWQEASLFDKLGS